MIVLNKRVVISQGNVNKQGDVHFDTQPQGAFVVRPRSDTPLQSVWWSPNGNLPGFDNFKAIRTKRASVTEWHKALVSVKSDNAKAAKIAIQLYAVAAGSVDHTVDATLGNDQICTLHTNDGATAAVTLTLPQAKPKLRGAEIFFELKEDETLKIVPQGTDTLLKFNGDPTTEASADQTGERLILKWIASGSWKVVERTTNWTLP